MAGIEGDVYGLELLSLGRARELDNIQRSDGIARQRRETYQERDHDETTSGRQPP